MPISFMGYPSGVAGTSFTIDKMFGLVARGKVNPDIIGLARVIVNGTSRKDYYSEARSIFEWVKKNIRYTRDPRNVELLQAPDVTIRLGHADCDDQAILINALAEAVGMQTGFETVRANADVPDEFSHVYSILRTDKGWRAADATVLESQFGWRPSAGVLGYKIWVR
jgi:hypothetical protein